MGEGVRIATCAANYQPVGLLHLQSSVQLNRTLGLVSRRQLSGLETQLAQGRSSRSQRNNGEREREGARFA